MIKKVFNILPIGFQIIDFRGIIIYSNRFHNEMHGYPPGFFVGKNVKDLFFNTETEKQRFAKYLDYLVRKRPTPTPYFNLDKCKDTTRIPVRVDWDYLYQDSHLEGFVNVISDLRGNINLAERAPISKKDKHSLETINYIKTNKSESHPIEQFTSREIEIFDLLCQGLTTKDIANKLNISVRTVEKHRENMLKKSGHGSTMSLLSSMMNNHAKV